MMNLDNTQILKSNLYELLQSMIEQIVEDKLKSLDTAKSNPKTFMSLSQAAEYLNLSKNTLYAYNNRRTIPFQKSGKTIYYKVQDLDAYVLKDSKHIKSRVEKENEFKTANMIKSLTNNKSRQY